MILREEFARLSEAFAEAVEDRPQLSGIRRENGQRVLPRIAFVDDDVQTEFDREVELLLEDRGLSSLDRPGVNGAREFAGQFGAAPPVALNIEPSGLSVGRR